MVFDFNKEIFEQEVVDSERYFRLAYSPTLETYLMFCLVNWIASYERFYVITKEDYELYQTDKDSFYQKFGREINQKRDCFTERFAGANALRDYDGANGFQRAFPLPDGEVNPFQHHVFVDGVFYARIVWQDAEILVPPVQAVIGEDGNFSFPLREKCEYQTDAEGQAICYKLKKEFMLQIHISDENDFVWLSDAEGNRICELRNSENVNIMYICQHPRFGPCVVASIRDENGNWSDNHLAYRAGAFQVVAPAR